MIDCYADKGACVRELCKYSPDSPALANDKTWGVGQEPKNSRRPKNDAC